jgi:hypothetical protein
MWSTIGVKNPTSFPPEKDPSSGARGGVRRGKGGMEMFGALNCRVVRHDRRGIEDSVFWQFLVGAPFEILIVPAAPPYVRPGEARYL